jgi:hydroxymethylglutaryl-CoA lyase
MIRIVEVGPRDGFQNQVRIIPTSIKVDFINALSRSGLSEIEVTSFVSPVRVPQLSDAVEVFIKITRVPGVTYSALVPNMHGFERAMAVEADKIALFTGASDSFTEHNINASIAKSIARFTPVISEAHQVGVPVRGYISTAFWCPYEGRIETVKTVDVAKRLADAGVDELSIGDTVGKATASETGELVEALLREFPPGMVAMHFHDTCGQAMENVLVSWQLGIETFDASVGGQGGCPFAPGSPGNVQTEMVVKTLRDAGAEVPVDIAKLLEAWQVLSELKE